MQEEQTLPLGTDVDFENGSRMRVVLAPYVEADALMTGFMAAIQETPVSFDSPEALSISVKNLISRLYLVPPFKAALWTCLGRCLYQPQGQGAYVKVAPSVFEPAAERGNLIQVYYACAEANISPFGKGLYAVSGFLSKVVVRSPSSTS